MESNLRTEKTESPPVLLVVNLGNSNAPSLIAQRGTHAMRLHLGSPIAYPILVLYERVRYRLGHCPGTLAECLESQDIQQIK